MTIILNVLILLVFTFIPVLTGCNAILGFEMNYDAGSEADTHVDEGPDTDTFSDSNDECQNDTCNEDLTAWLDYPGTCESSETDCWCEPKEIVCEAATGNECCDPICSTTDGCVTVMGHCPGSVDTCTDSQLDIGEVCTGCGDNGANGICGPGGSFACNALYFSNCQSISCSGDLYYCLEVGGNRKWTSTDICSGTSNDGCCPIGCTVANDKDCCDAEECNKKVKDNCVPISCGPCEDADGIECTTGICCDESNCSFKSSSVQCNTWTDYRCSSDGLSCGESAQQKPVTQFCRGKSASCDGSKQGTWQTITNCNTSSDICETDGTTYAKCTVCGEFQSCRDGVCSCDNEECAGICCAIDDICRYTEQCGSGEIEISANDGNVRDVFGNAVSISGDYVIVGSWQDDDNGPSSGSAYIYKKNGTVWEFQPKKLTALDGAASDRFGYSVSISGEYAIVGAFGDDSFKGAAYIYKRNGNVWEEQQKLIASEGVAADEFGYSVSISGNYAIVGAVDDSDNASRSGSAYIFTLSGTVWKEQMKLKASDWAELDLFGTSVCISGDYAIVGAKGDDDKGDGSGTAYIFRRNGASWEEQPKLTASDGATSDNFGVSVSISGDQAVVGAINNQGKGSAYVFKWDGTAWKERLKLTAADGATGDSFGVAVSMGGDYTIIGASGDDDKGSNSGSAYIFKWNGAIWEDRLKLTPSDGESMAAFGCSVSTSGDSVIIGARGKNDEQGVAYIY